MKILVIMQNMNREFWINVDPESDEMDTKLNTVLDICYEIYLWSLDAITEIWINEREIPKVGMLSKKLTEKIRSSSRYRNVQRYTLNRVIESGISQFNQELKINEDKINFPIPIRQQDYNTFVIPSRGIWKKYLEEHSRLSTAYGALYMSGDWIKTMQQQAKSIRVTMDYVPYLWHSLSVRRGWQIQFNLHEVKSHQGRIAKRKMKRQGFLVP